MAGMLDDRVVIVTGAGRGIGREHALACAAEGAMVLVNDVGGSLHGEGADSSVADAVVEHIVELGGKAVANTEDVSSFDGANRMVHAAIDAFGDLHAVVNNAGILRDRTLVSMSEDEWDAVIDVHLKGTFNLTHHAAAFWRDQSKAGRQVARALVNTSSGAGLHGNVGQANYAAAKAGIASLTVLSSMELERYGVKANCIAPFARTRLVDATPGLGEAVGDDPEFAVDCIAPLVVRLAAADCPFNGQVFSVYGGTVGIYQGWSVHAEVSTSGKWSPDQLAVAMDELPRSVAVNSQLAQLSEELDKRSKAGMQ